MLSYAKLWILLERKGMKKTDLTKNKIISPSTLAKLGKNETITSEVIEKICEFLQCQPGDIMEYLSDEQLRETTKMADQYMQEIMERLKAQGVTEEQFATLLCQVTLEQAKALYNGEKVTENLYNKTLELKNKENE